MSISKNYNCIKSVLATKGKTQKWLSEELRINVNTVSSWCRNTKQPKYENLYEIALILGVEMGDLLTKIKDLRDISAK
ncbi:helix-turn-helix domain-containing protein [Echinicola marina]|uniref:Helix-turn-helix transcriptional regulator n=1 Tax=Echinicola arenosa TaxID=2774144 RepID=A0ABR9ANE9_9BACT|nr:MULTISPECIES: helix-turn-helix transcriptional regulator [Echinicola]MBD8490074.1 helix-turn-helix transcriptional regulator [Echinicola arenosa]UCS93225.1 helix-turn-helix domain-containing protein [Echinicola marina]